MTPHEQLVSDAVNLFNEVATSEDVSFRLLERNARGEPMRFVDIPKKSSLRPSTYKYRAEYPHPIPWNHPTLSLEENEIALRRIQHLAPKRRCWCAVTMNMPWCVEELFLTGFPLDEPDEGGTTPLHLAAHLGHAECVQILVNAGANLDALTLAGVTPLDSAIASGRDEIASFLREKGARPAIQRERKGRFLTTLLSNIK